MSDDALDKTIEYMNAMLNDAKSEKAKLAIVDRLLKAYALKAKHSEDSKGGKFNPLNT